MRRVVLLLVSIVYAIVGQRLFAANSPDQFGTLALALFTVAPQLGALYNII